ncbi:MAG: YihY/virulence factor BrkB family protein [Bacteroidales bacterium]
MGNNPAWLKKTVLGKQIEKLVNRARVVTLPGLDGIPVYDVLAFFVKGFQKGSLVTRASSIAFNLLLAILPGTIFLFTLIPFIPIENLSEEILKFFENILPENAYHMMESTLVEVLTEKSGGLLFLMFISTLLFSSNGIHALISAFYISPHQFDTRGWITQRSVSIFLVLLVIMLFTLAIFLIIFSRLAIQKLVSLGILEQNFTFYLMSAGKWLITFALIYFAISFLYYMVPRKRTRWKFFSAGSSLASVGFLVASLGFSYFVNHFGQYNKFYGSIGTIMVVLLWMYFNSISLLIGFELNVSIQAANLQKELESGEQSQPDDVLYGEDQ